MFRVGVVGPEASVERILKVGKEFFSEANYVPFPYTQISELPDIVTTHDSQIDQWFFSGPLGYEYACDKLGTWENFSYSAITGAGFYSNCLRLVAQGEVPLDRISVDILHLSFLDQWLEELELPVGKIYRYEYPLEVSYDDLIRFHLDLWNQGKTVGAFTTISKVYEALKAAGVRVFFTTLSHMEIYQSLLVMMERHKAHYFKSGQVGRMILEIQDFDEKLDKLASPYERQSLSLRIQQGLLPLCQLLDGSLIDLGNGRYEIFSSRGLIEDHIGEVQKTLGLLSQELEIEFSAGIGFGQTIFSSELNAKRGLRLHRKGIVMVQEDGTIVERVDDLEGLNYLDFSVDPVLLEKLSQVNVGVRMYQRLKALTVRMGWEIFSSFQIAEQLGVTDRNIRRIIKNLAQVDLVEIAGEKSAEGRGRPSKLYRFSGK